MANLKFCFHMGAGGMGYPKENLLELNQRGIPFGEKRSDAMPWDAQEIAKQFPEIDNTVIFRRSVDVPDDKCPSGNPDVPQYELPPKEAALNHWEWHKKHFPPELDPAITWVETINEEAQHFVFESDEEHKAREIPLFGLRVCYQRDDGKWVVTNGEWMAEFAKQTALLTMADGYKWAAFGWSPGEPEIEVWEGENMLEFLDMCADHHDKLGIALHEYSLTSSDIWGGDGWLVGRFLKIYDICTANGIPYPTTMITEWGWTLWNVPNWEDAESDYLEVGELYAQYPSIKMAAIWALNDGWSGIAAKLEKHIDPLQALTLNVTYPEPDPPPVVTPPDPDPEPEPEEGELMRIDFTGWGESDGKTPIGWYDSDKCPNVQVPTAIKEGDRYPMVYEKFEGENPYNPDGKDWNDYNCPEGVIKWDELLPPNEHYFLNDEGRTYHWFCPQTAGRSRYGRFEFLQPGTYKLTLEFIGDFATFEDGQKVPQADPQHGQVELFLGIQGQDEMIDIELLGKNIITREYEITVAGEYFIGYGLLSRYAPGSNGVAGMFLQGFRVDAVTETAPPVEPPATGTTEEKIFQISQEWAFPVNEDAALQKAGLDDGYTPSGVERWLEVDGSLWAMQPFFKMDETDKKRSYYCLVNDWGNVEWTDGTPPTDEVIIPIPHMTQQGNDIRNECGAACAAMAINGMTTNNPTVDEVAAGYQNPPNSYMNFTQIGYALGGYDMAGTYQRPFMPNEIDDSIFIGYPVICLVYYPALPQKFATFNGSHFIIVYGAGDGYFLYRDPLQVEGTRLEITHDELTAAMAQVTNDGNMEYQGMMCEAVYEPPVEPPTGETVNVTQWIKGNNGQQFDMEYGSGTQTTMISHQPDGSFLYVKGTNGEYERLWIAPYNGEDWIWRADDTSESPTRMYAHYRSEGGALGAPWFPCNAVINQWYETGKFVQHYLKDGCVPQNNGNVVDKIRLTSKPYTRTYPLTGQTLEVITLEWSSGEQYDFKNGNVGFRDATRNFEFMQWLEGRQPLPIKKYDCFGW